MPAPGLRRTFAAPRIWRFAQRDLRLALGAKNARELLRRVVLFGVAVVALIVFGDTILTFRSTGWIIFMAFAGATLFFVASATYGLAAELAEESRSEMLQLIFVTGTKSRELFASKLLARFLMALYPTLALLPCLAVGLLYRNTTWTDVVVFALLAAAVFIFLAGTEFLGAAVESEGEAAENFALWTQAIVVGAPWLLEQVARLVSGVQDAGVFWLSPAFAAFQFFEGTAGQSLPAIHASLSLTFAMALAMIAISASILDRRGRDEPQSSGARNLGAKLARAWAARIRPILERSPALWLAAFDRRAAVYAWMPLVILLALWTAALVIWGADWLFPMSFYLLAAGLIWSLRVQMLIRASRRMARARRDGELELLLTTPLTPDELIAAEHEALSLQFRPIILAARALVILCLAAVTLIHHWEGQRLFSHILVCAILLWALPRRTRVDFYLWSALNTGQATGALVRLQGGSLLSLFFPMFNLIRHGLPAFTTFPSGSDGHLWIAIGVAALFFVLTVVNWSQNNTARGRLHEHFRAIAQTPLPPAEVVKKWDFQTPLIATNRFAR